MGIFFVGVVWVGWFVLWICILMLVTVKRAKGGGDNGWGEWGESVIS